MSAIGRGILAGAVGTLALDAVTYLDMAVTGRPASGAPGETVRRAAGALGADPPGDPDRVEAYGALGGIATGVGLGVAASLARAAGVRLPAPIGAVAIGGLAMAATDLPMAAGGVSHPRDWSRADWARDVVPHLAYGAGVRWAMDRVDRPVPVSVTPDPARGTSRAGLLVRSAALGVATGIRNSLALAGPLAATGGGRATGIAAAVTAAELASDKAPGVPSRIAPVPLAGRLFGGAVGAGVLARHHEAGAVTATAAGVLGAAGAFAGAVAGVVWRDLAAERGWTWQAALAEDGVALGLTAAAWR
jgi:hypothetical protein